jgi:hypothetical protein
MQYSARAAGGDSAAGRGGGGGGGGGEGGGGGGGEQLGVTPPPVAVAPPPEPPKSVMFDSDPKGEWNIFPDPTSGEIGVYHKGDYVGAVDGSENEDPPVPHPGKTSLPSDDDAPAEPR